MFFVAPLGFQERPSVKEQLSVVTLWPPKWSSLRMLPLVLSSAPRGALFGPCVVGVVAFDGAAYVQIHWGFKAV